MIKNKDELLSRFKRTVNRLLKVEKDKTKADLLTISDSTNYIYGYTLLEIGDIMHNYPYDKKDFANDSLIKISVGRNISVIFVISD